MAGISLTKRIQIAFGLFALALCLPQVSYAQSDVVTTYKDENGWQLRVNGEPYYMKGVVWGYTPRGQNYTYNLFGQSDDQIRKILDYDFGLMAEMGVNTIRTFTMIPPKWVTYIYEEHGIMSIINPLMGRYGYNINGKWVPFTDYSDPATREILKRDMQVFVERYKDTKGVLMFAFGNESNYGLSWSSFEIENLPEGEQNTAKARYLYSLFEEVIAAGKAIAPNQPFTIVNGDLQYIDLIQELMPSLDVLGSNVYRGKSFTDLWAVAEEKLDLPVAFFEFGSDAFNARSFQEDQLNQALILKDQWEEMYRKSYGMGEEGNSIGAFIFEWRDEWWKYLQIEQLDIQNTNASWANQGYEFDWAPGQNNMNEEWFGIVALGPTNSDGVSTARPRTAFYVMQQIFTKSPLELDRDGVDRLFAGINLELLDLKGEVGQLAAESAEDKRLLRLTGGRFEGEMVLKGAEKSIDEEGRDALEFSDGQSVFLDFAFEPNDKTKGQMTVNLLGNVADKQPLEFSYGDRGRPVSVLTEQFIQIGDEQVLVEVPVPFNDQERIEIYDFNATYEGENADIEAFYHTSRFHWGYEGDHWGLLRETTDIPGMDIWNAKAPYGVEFTGKGKFKNMTFLIGPEVYWGANPKAMFKYDFRLANFDWTFIHSHDIARRTTGVDTTDITSRQNSQTAITAEREFANGIKLELGGLFSSPDEIEESFERVDRAGNVFLDEIEFEDTLGFRGKITFPWQETYLKATHAGLVADAGTVHRTFGIMDPSRLPNDGMGNKQEVEAGMIVRFGDYMLMPRVLYRDNLVHANPFIEPRIENGILRPGTTPRDTDSDPFAVLGNREARSAELYLTYDPTGATQFYDWDNDWREDAKFAYNIGGTYTRFPTKTDSYLFFFDPLRINVPFGEGLAAEDVWAVSSRIVMNPNPSSRYIFRFIRGFEQSTGNPGGLNDGNADYFEFHWRAEWNRKHFFSGFYKNDAFGPYDFFRQFNLQYPHQVQMDYSMLLGGSGVQFGSIQDEQRATRVGIRAQYRSLQEGNETFEQDGDYIFQTILYFTYQF
ncbi:MAG: hypothetical protein QNJ05_14545 [Woeseiaceae bacterium]|nr:hypothetical protein [Woeseiaceae bacterium]